MANHTQVAPSGEATFTSNIDRASGVDFPASGQVSLEAAGVQQLLAAATTLVIGANATAGLTIGPAAVNGIALGSTNRAIKVVKVPLAALDTGGGVFGWVNPEGAALLATVILDVTTKATAACTIDVGYTASSITTSSDTSMDGLDVGTAAGVFSPFLAASLGTNGLPWMKVASGKWITASKASGAAAGLAGSAYIVYMLG